MGAEAGSTFQPAGASNATLPFVFSAEAITRTLSVFGSLLPKTKTGRGSSTKTRRSNDERLAHFACDAIDPAEARLQLVSNLFAADIERELDGKGRRIFRAADERLVRDREGAERPRFAQPIRLRKRQRLRQLHARLFCHELRWVRRVDVGDFAIREQPQRSSVSPARPSG